ncbi:fungal-specific transcription factor domain-containing protein [Ustulina deusta]|nr:fungal-specific transcription factor domain-containing protein [Ustulina deusta]
MFTTFYGMTPSTVGRDDGSPTATPAAVSRPKRSQVRHACDWCKMMRTKCDNHRPCAPCRHARRDCTRSGENRFRSMAEAVSEVQRLRAQVCAFEGRQVPQPTPSNPSTASRTLSAVVGDSQGQPERQQPPPVELDEPLLIDQWKVQDRQSPLSHQERQQRTSLGDGAKASSRPSQNTTQTGTEDISPPASVSPSAPPSRNGVRVDSIPYGVTSMPFFLSRMEQFLQTVLKRPQLDLNLDAFACATAAGSGSSPRPPGQLVDHTHLQQDTIKTLADDFLPRAQESLFHGLFWQTHYFSFPILNEGQFRRDYKSLWDESPSQGPRKASPLVDIVTALCIQLGGSLVRQRSSAASLDARAQNDHRPSPASGSPSLGGFQYYRRCQDAIDLMTESPSIEHVQCCIFSIVYLYEAGLLNSAHVMAGKAIMMAMILGLPNEPQADQPEPRREVARRTWWSLYILDAKLSIEAGRPPMIGPWHSLCRLPSDSADVARWLGPHYSFDDSCPTWLGFQTQTLRLLEAVLAVRSVLFAKYDNIVGANGYKAFVSNAVAREECACLLTERMKELGAWAKQVPGGYLVARRQGESFSTDRAPLVFEADMIIHCQRQRVLLELQYHAYCMSLYQPFICFASPADELTPVSDAKAAAALAHAMTLTSMIYQSLTKSEVLSGIYHVFRWQKNALFTMLGFTYTYPINGSAAATRKSIETAVAVVEMYRDILAEAGPVAAIGRALAQYVGAAIVNLSTGDGGWSSSSPTSVVTPVALPGAQATASDAQPVVSKLPVPAQHDWNTMSMHPSADKMRGQGSLPQFSEEVASMETVEMLLATFEPSVDWWTPMGDFME